MLLLSLIPVRNLRSTTSPRSFPAPGFQFSSLLLPLSLAGSLCLVPGVSQARITPAQRAIHAAHLARRKAIGNVWAASAQQAMHNARLAQRQAAHRAHLLQLSPIAPAAKVLTALPAKGAALQAAATAAHQQRVLQQQARHAARLAKAQAKHQALLAARQAKLALRQRSAEARLAAVRQKAALKYAKLHQQHLALVSGNVVEAAYAFRGSRYVMGGTSRSGFDCSGFVRYILSNAGGVSVPRTAVEQFIHGAPIAPDAMQPGDLVFFKNTYKHGISHVGIYAGNGQFIHAANAHKGVRMDALNEPYYVAHFAGARRVLPAQMRQAAFLAQQPQ